MSLCCLIVLVLYRGVLFVVFFFFSSRRRHTRSDRDWSSDVCSCDLPVEWAVAASGEGSAAVAQIDATGAFVAETPGVYTVTASLGGRSADAVVRVEQRRVTRGIDVLAHLPIKYRTAEAWGHPSGKCLYKTTIAHRA